MTDQEYEGWLEAMKRLSPDQYRRTVERVIEARDEASVVAALEDLVGPERRCPHCSTPRAVRRGAAAGLRRYHCRGCGRTFNALTGTYLAKLHMRGKWLDFAAALADRDTVRKSALRCGVAVSTAFRWRHRFLKAVKAKVNPESLTGVVESDPTQLRTSYKGRRKLWRKARRRGGAKGPGADRATHVVFAVARGGATFARVLASLSADNLRAAYESLIAKDAILVTDAHAAMEAATKHLKARHETVNVSAGGRVQGPFHLQTVNNRHSRFHTFLAPFNGVATKYLGNYAAWFLLNIRDAIPTPRSCFEAVLTGRRIIYGN